MKNTSPEQTPVTQGHSNDFLEAKRRIFLDYTATKAAQRSNIDRFEGLKRCCETVLDLHHRPRSLKVLDVGSGTGVQAALWRRGGHFVVMVDLDFELLRIGHELSSTAEQDPVSVVSSAEDLPIRDSSMDLCLGIELLEHLPDWQRCLKEFSRVLKPGGLLLLSTTNAICPKQNEFHLPLYSWWPAAAKRRAVNLARTSRPELANFTSYPALHWFTSFGLSRALGELGFDVFDRIDVMDLTNRARPTVWLVRLARKFKFLRLILYIFMQSTIVFAHKHKRGLRWSQKIGQGANPAFPK